MPGDRPLSPRQAIKRIRELWTTGAVKFLPHAWQRMEQRKVNLDDVARVLMSGHVIEHSKPGQWWRYTVRGRAIDGDPIECVTEINDRLVIVTVIVP